MSRNKSEPDYHESVQRLLRYVSQSTPGIHDATTRTYIDQLIDAKRSVPDLGHFIWIGDISRLDTSYIRIWSQSNKRIKFALWHHPGTDLCSIFHQILNDHVRKNGKNNFTADLIQLQNESFDFIFQRINNLHSFNDAALEFLRFKKITAPDICYFSASTALTAEGVTLRDVNELFDGEYSFFRKIYFYEIILRGNLACASDILRLLILHKYGGIYLDVDTLPDIEYLFIKTNEFLRDLSIPPSEHIIAFKSHAFTGKVLHGRDFSRTDIKHIFPENITLQDELFQSVCYDLTSVTLDDIIPLPEIYCYPDLISLSSLRNTEGVYFSNVICSCSGSRFLRILLKVIKKRYNYLEKNNAVFAFNSEEFLNDYLSRLLPYRYEPIIKNGSVTLFLTGPGVIFEVLLGLFYQIFRIDDNYSPGFLANFLHNEAFGIAFFNHTLYTPAGLSSTWMDD